MAIVQSRMKRFVNEKERLGRTVSIREVQYLIAPYRESKGLSLYLGLNYGVRKYECIHIGMFPAVVERDPQLVQDLPSSTESESSINFLRSKFRECRQSHSNCRQRSDSRPRWHPSRLLEIGNDHHTVYLRNRDELRFEPYFTLSHCWGKTKPFQLTRATEAWLKAGIPTERLPKTFRDALLITSKFSVAYIWIDSLCIFQDNFQDWRTEASTMCEVYSHSLCNIAATGAVDGSDGLFFERDTTAERPCMAEVNLILEKPQDPHIPPVPPSLFGTYELFLCDQWERDLERGALNKRAWVMQERFLSTRVLHFSSTQVFWECLENQSSELFQDAIPEMAQVAPVWDIQSLKRILVQTQNHDRWTKDLLDSWRRFIIQYSKCELSKESDKLIAIHGIQKLVSEMTGDTLLYGLWRSNLVEELCWSRSSALHAEKSISGNCYPQTWYTPTWSWASSKEAVWPGDTTECLEVHSHVTIEASDIIALESKEPDHASLVLRGKVSNVTSVIKGLSSIEKYAANFSYDNAIFRAAGFEYERLMEIIFDNLDSCNEPQLQDELVCMKMVSCGCESSENRNHKQYLLSLVLKPGDVAKKQYDRVGLLRVDGTYYDYYVENETKVEQSLVLT